MDDKGKSGFVFGWKVIAYLFLAGVGGGASAVSAVFHLVQSEPEAVTKMGVILGAPLVLIGCLFLFFDLGRPTSSFRAISRLNKAWISRGTLILTLFIIVGAIQFGFWIWPFHGLASLPSLFTFLNVLGGILGVLTVIYTGLLFDTTRSIPFWSTPILPLLFLVSGVSTGIFGSNLILILSGASNIANVALLSRIDVFIILFEGLVIFFYLHGMHEVTAARASVRRVTRGDLSASFWIGLVLVGLVIPFILEAFWSHDTFAVFLASLCGLVGGIFVRYVVVYGAVKAPLNAEGVLIYLSPRPE